MLDQRSLHFMRLRLCWQNDGATEEWLQAGILRLCAPRADTVSEQQTNQTIANAVPLWLKGQDQKTLIQFLASVAKEDRERELLVRLLAKHGPTATDKPERVPG